MQYPFGHIPDEDKTGIKRWNLIHDEMMPILGLYKQSDITDILLTGTTKLMLCVVESLRKLTAHLIQKKR